MSRVLPKSEARRFATTMVGTKLNRLLQTGRNRNPLPLALSVDDGGGALPPGLLL